MAFSLSRRDASPRARALAPLAWAFLLSVQCMVAGRRHFRPAAAGHVGGQSAFGRAGGRRRLLPAAAACCVAGRRVLTAGLLCVPLALLILALFWLPSPGVGFALAWLLLGFGLGLRSLTVRRGQPAGLPGRLLLPAGSAAAAKAVWLGGGALLLFFLRVMGGWCRV